MKWIWGTALSFLGMSILLLAFNLLTSTPGNSVESIDNRHDVPRLRGAMTGTDLTESDIQEFGQNWNANHIRWQLLWYPLGDTTNLEQYNAWLLSELDNLDRILPYARSAGIKVLVDLHTLPGGSREDESTRILTDISYQNALVDVWKMIAERYKDNSIIWGYDLANEPVLYGNVAGVKSWHELATLVATEIRKIDNEHAIIFEPVNWANPYAFSDLQPIPVSGIVYSLHMYRPHAFTHQGIGDFGPLGVSYPGVSEGEFWDKNRLLQELQPVINFQNKYAVPIYVGEFSALRWSPGDSAYLYLKDCIDIFEQYGWDWSYHAFREWDGWSVEHGNNINDETVSPIATSRQELLQSWYALNVKPDFDAQDNSTPVETPENTTPAETPENTTPIETPENTTPVETPENTTPVDIPENAAQVDSRPTEKNINHINYFLLEISSILQLDASVNYKTIDGTAVAGEDYISTEGTAIITAGELNTVIPVIIKGDSIIESDEYFLLKIFNPQGASFPIGVEEIQITRWILNDDS